ncbi:MAG: LysM peptidoglycan-binding domain-containing protein [Bacteroidota bacterium]
MFPNLTGGLSSLLSIVPLPGKMTIIPLKDTAPIPVPAGPPYVVMFNPETISENQAYYYTDEQEPGSGGAVQRFKEVPPKYFSFEFLIDGTGASGDKREVTAEVELFKAAVELKGEFHRPPFLALIYGSFITTCVLTKMDVTYTMFRKNGTPLRAKIKANFVGHTKKLLNLLVSNFLSPDLTRRITTREGDTLPQLCNAVYESPRFYIEAAKANGLTSFRKLNVGQELTFPPIKK